MRDVLDQIRTEIRGLRNDLRQKQTSGGDEQIKVDVDQPQPQPQDNELDVGVSEPNETNTADYFSTGQGGVILDSPEFNRIEFGQMARVVNLRFDDDIVVAFRNPYQGSGGIIPLSSSESPFTIGDGGEDGIGTAFLWARKADSATSNPTLNVIAYK